MPLAAGGDVGGARRAMTFCAAAGRLRESGAGFRRDNIPSLDAQGTCAVLWRIANAGNGLDCRPRGDGVNQRSNTSTNYAASASLPAFRITARARITWRSTVR